jgi:hypothetical protein
MSEIWSMSLREQQAMAQAYDELAVAMKKNQKT